MALLIARSIDLVKSITRSLSTVHDVVHHKLDRNSFKDPPLVWLSALAWSANIFCSLQCDLLLRSFLFAFKVFLVSDAGLTTEEFMDRRDGAELDADNFLVSTGFLRMNKRYNV